MLRYARRRKSMEPRTGAERYFRDRQRDPEYAAANRPADG
jgi:hypothetical protein